MKNLRKRISVLLAFLLVIAFVPVFSLPVSAAGTFELTGTTSYEHLISALADTAYDTIIVKSGVAIDSLGNHNITIPAGKTLTIEVGATLRYPAGTANYTNNGTINVFGNLKTNDSVTNNGVINNVGTFGSTNFTNNGTFTGSGAISQWDFTVKGTNSTQYAVSFDENHAGTAPDTVTLYAASIGVLMPADPTRTGYTFTGWNTAADGSGTAFDSATALSVLGTTSPVTATVYGQWVSQACAITGFTVPNQVGTTTINGTSISVTVPYGTDLTTLAPTITVSAGATVSPASGTATNFTSPVTFTVTAQDGSTQAYTVTVTVGAPIVSLVTVTSGTGGGSYPQGATVNITADLPSAGQKFDSWTSNDVTFANENMATTSFVMPAGAVSVTATYKAIPPTAEKYTITLGASGNGTVRGGGSYDENTTVTVTATPNAGSSFVSWTENGVVVSTDANYNFAVTTDRTLIAVFEKNGTDPDPVDPTTYIRSSDGSVGSNKADTSPNLKPAVVGRLFTKAEATKLFGAALAAKPAEQKTLSFRAQNFTKVDKAVLAELGALAQKNGVTLTVHFDSMVGKAVTYRVSVNPATIQTDLDLTAKIVGGKLTLPKFPVPVEIAVRMPAGVTMETLKITENGKNVTTAAKPWLDKVGYLHFTTTGGEIVLGK